MKIIKWHGHTSEKADFLFEKKREKSVECLTMAGTIAASPADRFNITCSCVYNYIEK